uniref:Sulfotransferase n=1 Tax=Brassica campestris TaxID=3711 RepID=M4F0C6_BRACM
MRACKLGPKWTISYQSDNIELDTGFHNPNNWYQNQVDKKSARKSKYPSSRNGIYRVRIGSLNTSFRNTKSRTNIRNDPKELPSNIRDDKKSEETKKLISSLPSHTDSQGHKICQYQGCWYYYNTLQGVLNFQRGFQPQDTDIILASYPKSGTTWLKALTVALLERSKSHSSYDDHPLLYDNPHGIVPFLETYQCSSSNLAKFSASPRLLSTHMPLHAMHETLKHCSCKIVLEINKTGKRNNLNHKDYFRKGEVGDSKNYLTPEMEKKIDMIIQEKLQGSGLKF